MKSSRYKRGWAVWRRRRWGKAGEGEGGRWREKRIEYSILTKLSFNCEGGEGFHLRHGKLNYCSQFFTPSLGYGTLKMPPSRGGGIYIPTLLALGLAMWLALANDMWAKTWGVITWFGPFSWASVICHEKSVSWELLLPEWDTWGRFKSDLQLKPSLSLSSQSPAGQQTHKPAKHMFAIRRHRAVH